MVVREVAESAEIHRPKIILGWTWASSVADRNCFGFVKEIFSNLDRIGGESTAGRRKDVQCRGESTAGRRRAQRAVRRGEWLADFANELQNLGGDATRHVGVERGRELHADVLFKSSTDLANELRNIGIPVAGSDRSVGREMGGGGREVGGGAGHPRSRYTSGTRQPTLSARTAKGLRRTERQNVEDPVLLRPRSLLNNISDCTEVRNDRQRKDSAVHIQRPFMNMALLFKKEEVIKKFGLKNPKELDEANVSMARRGGPPAALFDEASAFEINAPTVAEQSMTSCARWSRRFPRDAAALRRVAMPEELAPQIDIRAFNRQAADTSTHPSWIDFANEPEVLEFLLRGRAGSTTAGAALAMPVNPGGDVVQQFGAVPCLLDGVGYPRSRLS